MEQRVSKPGKESAWGAEPFVAVIVGAVVYVMTDIGLLVAGLGTLGLLFAYGGFRSIWHALRTRSVERVSIGTLHESGGVEVEGTVRRDAEAITTPLTGTESVAYKVEVSEWDPPSEQS